MAIYQNVLIVPLNLIKTLFSVNKFFISSAKILSFVKIVMKSLSDDSVKVFHVVEPFIEKIYVSLQPC